MTTANDLAIDLHHVSKTYKGKVHALRGIDLQVERGQVFGLLGPNGAGKSTLVKIMMTVIRASEATGTILGQPIGHKPTLKRVGYLPEHHHLPKFLTARKAVRHYAVLSGLNFREARTKADEMLSEVGMMQWADRKIKTFSKGMQQRVGIAQAMVHQPDLVILDEPTDGVDPVGRREIRDALARFKERGCTIFVNSHLLSELEMISDRVAIMVKGLTVKQGTVEDLSAGRMFYEILMDQNPKLQEKLKDILDCTWKQPIAPPQPPPAYPGAPVPPPTGLPTIPGYLKDHTEIELYGSQLRVKVDTAVPLQKVIDQLRAKNMVIHAMRQVRPSLEDMFMEYVMQSGGYTPGAVMTQQGVQTNQGMQSPMQGGQA